MTNLAPSARDFIIEGKSARIIDEIVSPALRALNPSEFDWSGASLLQLLANRVVTYNVRVAQDAKRSSRIHWPLEDFDFNDLKNLRSAAHIGDDLDQQRSKLLGMVDDLKSSRAADSFGEIFAIVRAQSIYNSLLVEWFVEALAYEPENDEDKFDALAYTDALRVEDRRGVDGQTVRNVRLLSLMLGAFQEMQNRIGAQLASAVALQFSSKSLPLIGRRVNLEDVKEQKRVGEAMAVQSDRFHLFLDSLMGCWDVLSLKRTLARLDVELHKLLIYPEDDVAREFTKLLMRSVQARIDGLTLRGPDHRRFYGVVDTSAVSRGRHLAGLVSGYFELKSQDMTAWSEAERSRYQQYYHLVRVAAGVANDEFQGALANYNVRADYQMIESLVELPDEVDTRTIFWDANDPEIKSAGVSVPQARGVDAKVRVVLPDSYTLRYHLDTGWPLDGLFDQTPNGSIWDNLIQSVRYRYLRQIQPRLEADGRNRNRSARTDWLDRNVVIAIGLVGQSEEGESRFFDTFDRHHPDARAHAMLTWRQFSNPAFTLHALKKVAGDARVGPKSDATKMSITEVIVRIYALPPVGGVGNPNREYERSYDTISRRLLAVNRRTHTVGRTIATEPLIDQTNLRAFLTFVRRENLVYARDREDEKKRAAALREVARRLGFTADARRPGQMQALKAKITTAKARLALYVRLHDAIRAWKLRSAFAPAPMPEDDDLYGAWLEQRERLLSAAHDIGRNTDIYKAVMDSRYNLQEVGDKIAEAVQKFDDDIEKMEASLRRLQQNEEKSIDRELDDLDREMELEEKEAEREGKRRERKERDEKDEKEYWDTIRDVLARNTRQQARALLSSGPSKRKSDRKERKTDEAAADTIRNFLMLERARRVGKFSEKAIVLANQSLGRDWFERQFHSSIYVPILNRSDHLCLFWATSLALHKLQMRAKGKNFSYGAWAGAKPKIKTVEEKDEKDEKDVEMETEVVVFGGRDPDTCKPWKKFCYKLLHDLLGPMAGPQYRTKFPDDVIRLSEMIGYPIAVVQALPSGKVRVVLDTIAHAPQTVAVKKRVARQLKKAKEQDAAFAAALHVDPGLPHELKSGYQMTTILPNSEHIVLFYSGKPAFHFDLIQGKEIGKFMERSQTDKDRLCRHCMDIYKTGTSHKCVYARCDRCHKNNCPSNFLTDEQYYGADKKECDECWQFFLTDTCFAAHKKKGKSPKAKSVCEKFKYCKECSVFYKTVTRVGGPFKENKVIYQHNTEDGKSGHIHRGEVCQQCNDIVERGHECMFAKIKLPDPLYHFIGVYDTESVQPDGIHSTCLVVHSEGLATNPQHEYRRYKTLKDRGEVKSIDDYHPTIRKERSRYVASVADEKRAAAEVFVDRMLALREDRKQDAKERKEREQLDRTPASSFTMLGFNSSGYDLPLLLQALCHNSADLSVSTTYLGTRLLKLMLARGLTSIKFIDANRFIPGSLARTVKTFGLEPELKAIGEPIQKGVAPFFFLQPDYVGAFPDKICFPTKDRRQPWFNDWYEEEKLKFIPHTDQPYVYMEELIKYCTQDTRILGLAVSAFREQFLKATNRQLDPFCYTTLTSACMAYYSAQHMPEHKIANLPAKVNRALRLSLYGGRVENRRALFPVPTCRTPPSEATGYRQFSSSAYLVHLDYTSLYPSVLIDGLFPWGHPKWFLRDKSKMDGGRWTEKDRQTWELIIEPLRNLDCLPFCDDLSLDDVEDVLLRFLQPGSCAVLLCDYTAPRDLWDPVLPSRTEKSGNRYDLEPHAFQMVNSVELRVALRKGYTVDFIYAIAYCPPEWCSTSMFTSYYGKFVTQKDQCSGWPAGCDTEEKKQAYLKAYREHPKNFGMELNPDEIEDNPGGREINKFAINSHWGRYAMADDHPHHEIYDMEDAKSRLGFYNTMFNVERNYCVSTPTVISSPDGSKAKIQVSYKRVDDTKKEIEKGSPTNVLIGVFTTAHARMRLYEELEKLAPGRIFYMDTDSITLVVDPEMKDVPVGPGQLRWDELPPTGSFLGQLKWEPKPGYKIRFYSSTGRKSYHEFGTYTDEAWRQYLELKSQGKEQPDCICNKSANCPAFVHAKVVTKGLPETPNADFAYHFTRVSIARQILGLPAPNPYECHFSLLKRVPAKQAVHTIPTVRKYRLFNESSVLDPVGLTLPHGHCDVKTVLDGWEESAQSVREMLADAEECLEKVAHKAVGYQFMYSYEPDWVQPDHPEHKEKMAAWQRRESERVRLMKEHAEKIQMEEQLANQIEAAARAEGERQQALLDEAGAQLQALQDEIDRVEAEHEAAIRQYDEREEEDLDLNDNEDNYAVGDVEPEGNEFIEDQPEMKGHGHEDDPEEFNPHKFLMDETGD